MRLRYLAILSTIALFIVSGVSFGQVPTQTPPQLFYFVHPAADSRDVVNEGESYTIEWANFDLSWSHFILFYQQNGILGAEKIRITTTPVLVAGMTFTDDNPARVTRTGNFNVVAQVTNEDGSMPGPEFTSAGYVTINVGSQPRDDFVFINPSRPNETPRNGNYTIMWESMLSGGLNLYYSSASVEGNIPLGAIMINTRAIGLPTVDPTYIWDTSLVDEGVYYIYAEIEIPASIPGGDPTFEIYNSDPGTVEVGGGSQTGYFDFTKPARPREQADDLYIIEWDTDLTGFVNLIYTNNDISDPVSGQINDLPINILDYKYTWITRDVQPGVYYIVAEVDTGIDPETLIFESNGSVEVNDKNFWFQTPPAEGDSVTVSFNSSYTIFWNYDFTGTLTDPNTLTLNLSFDTDLDTTNGRPTSIAADLPLTNQNYRWMLPNIQGTYYIYGEVFQPNPASPDPTAKELIMFNYSGPLTLTQGVAQDLVITKPSNMRELADATYDVKYVPFKVGSLVLYADSDTNPSGLGAQISGPIAIENDDIGIETTFTWSTLGEPDGSEWFIYGIISMTGGGFYSTYSAGTVLIQHAPQQDRTPPGQIVDLIAYPDLANPTVVELRWTAPGDDNYLGGPAAQYDIRFASTPDINETDWESYTKVGSLLTPGLPGSDESVTVSGLTALTKYHFAVKTADEVPNWSPISNIAIAETVPVELTEFYALPGDGVISLYWKTATERNNLGFNVMRKSEDSIEFTKINDRMIQGAGTSSAPHSYSFDDTNVRNGVLYTYKLEIISIDGLSEFSDPVEALAGATSRPIILWGGYFESNVSEMLGGYLTLKAYVQSRVPVRSVEVLYKGVSTEVYLTDDANNGDEVAGDGVYTLKVRLTAGLPVGEYMFELRAIDINGNESDIFPYLTVH